MSNGVVEDARLMEDFLMLGAHLTQQLCTFLKLPASTASLAQIYLHTFYTSSTTHLLTHALLDITMGSVLLAAKASESHRRVRDVVNMGYLLFHKLRRVDFSPMPYVCDAYFSWRERVTKAEIMVLRALEFKSHYLLPHGLLVNYLRALELLKDKKLAQKALNYANDAFRNPALALQPPERIACASIYAACDDSRIDLPRDWHLVFDVSSEDLRQAVKLLDRVYKWRLDPALPITPPELRIFAEEYDREVVYMEGRFKEKRRRRSSSPIPPPSPEAGKATGPADNEYASLYSDFSSSPATPK